MILTTIKLTGLVVAVWFTEVNFAKLVRGHAISAWNFVLQALAIVIFVALQFNLF